MKKIGSKDGNTWEEQQRKGEYGDEVRFGDLHALNCLMSIRQWCDQKITEISARLENENLQKRDD